MEGKDFIYNGLGYVTYSLCMADEIAHDAEVENIEELVKETAEKHNFESSFADGIFRLNKMEHLPQTTALHKGIDAFEKGSAQLNSELQKEIISFLNEIVGANGVITEVEELVINKVKECFSNLN